MSNTQNIDQEYELFDSLSDTAIDALFDVFVETRQHVKLKRLSRVISYRIDMSMASERFTNIESYGYCDQ